MVLLELFIALKCLKASIPVAGMAMQAALLGGAGISAIATMAPEFWAAKMGSTIVCGKWGRSFFWA